MSKVTRHPCRLEQCLEKKLGNPSKWNIQGFSRAGDRTGFFIKEPKIILDCGLATYRNSNAVVIGHGHADHTLCLPQLINRRSTRLKGQEHLNGKPVFCPEKVKYKIHLLNKAVYELSDDSFDETRELTIEEVELRQGYHLFGVKAEPNVYIEIPGYTNLKMEILQAYHTNQNCVGYGFNSFSKKLKEEYNHLKGSKEGGQEIKRLKESGENVYDDHITPELLYFCDSSIHNLSEHDEWKKYPVIICECTGYPGYQESDKMTMIEHSHLDLLKPIILDNLDKQWILIHASMAVPDDYLETKEKELQDEGIDVTIWRDERC
jgi:ribonuclease BN (tRNA processing enzyme)